MTMRNALIVSLLVTSASDAIWLLTIGNEVTYAIALFLQYFTPVLTSSFCGYLTKRALVSGLLTAVVTLIGFALSSMTFELLGNQVDFPGIRGALLVASLSAPYCLIASLIGAYLGVWCATRIGGHQDKWSGSD